VGVFRFLMCCQQSLLSPCTPGKLTRGKEGPLAVYISDNGISVLNSDVLNFDFDIICTAINVSLKI
jgi:hypothetical protein